MRLDKYREVADKLLKAQRMLERFMDAVQMLGFTDLAAKIERVHNLIGEAIDLLQETVAEDVGEQFQAAKEASGNMLAAVMAGVELGSRDR